MGPFKKLNFLHFSCHTALLNNRNSPDYKNFKILTHKIKFIYIFISLKDLHLLLIKTNSLVIFMPKNFYKNFLIYLLLGLTALSAKDSKISEDNNGSDLKSEIKSYILHHLEDSHDFNFDVIHRQISGKKVYIGMPLPVILWDNGIKIFSSTKLNHGKTVVQSGDNYYKLYHGKVYQTDAKGN